MIVVTARGQAVAAVEKEEGKAVVFSYFHVDSNRPLWRVFVEPRAAILWFATAAKYPKLCYDGLEVFYGLQPAIMKSADDERNYKPRLWIDIEGRMERFLMRFDTLPQLRIWSETVEGVWVNNLDRHWYMGPEPRNGRSMVYWSANKDADAIRFRMFENKSQAEIHINHLRNR